MIRKHCPTRHASGARLMRASDRRSGMGEWLFAIAPSEPPAGYSQTLTAGSPPASRPNGVRTGASVVFVVHAPDSTEAGGQAGTDVRIPSPPPAKIAA